MILLWRLQAHPEEAPFGEGDVGDLRHDCSSHLMAFLPSAPQEILEEVRKELQKVKEEIIGGGTPWLLLTRAASVRRLVC